MLLFTRLSLRGGGQGFSPATMMWPLATFFGKWNKNRHLLVVHTWQLKILVISLFLGSVFHHDIQVY